MNEKVAIVTGGTGALGRHVVNKLADEGIKVYVPSLTIDEFNEVFDSSQEKDSEYSKLRKIFSFVCNATDENSVKEFVNAVSIQENGKIDFLINTVGGVSPSSKVFDLATENLENMLSLNFRSAFYFSRESLGIMKKNNYGRIISIGAISALEPASGRFAYSFSKSGVIFLMDTISKEMKSHNIRCNTIIPSIIDTPANREWGTPEDIKKWVKPEDIAKIIYSLLSDEFSAVRNTHIKVYGAF